MIGQTLGRYRIEEKIGAGGMGVVYRAHDQRLERDVALKVLPAGLLNDESARKRFHREALTLSKLNHPNIAHLYDFDTRDGVDFLVLEFVPGKTLGEKLSTDPLPEKEIIRLGTQLAEGVRAAHKKRIVHRDLKPGNVRVTPAGQLKILDFGVAELIHHEEESRLTDEETQSAIHTGSFVGTPVYMAPEQVQHHKVDTRTDIYGVGLLLYELATGRRAFPDKVFTTLVGAILHRMPPAPRQVRPDLSPALERVILKCLEKDPQRRHQSLDSLLTDLRRIGPATAQMQGVRIVSRRWIVAATIVVVLSGVGVGIGIWQHEDAHSFSTGLNSRPSLAVLPFENLSGDSGDEYFSQAITEEITSTLSRVQGLQVAARISALQFKDTVKDIRQIGAELGVNFVLEGSVRKAGERLRISAQLIDTKTGFNVWSEDFDGKLDDVLSVQAHIARDISRGLHLKFSGEEERRLAKRYSKNPEAYRLYLNGRYYWNRRTAENLRKGLAFFQNAIATDPDFALAYVGVAESYLVLNGWRVIPTSEAIPAAREAALKAIELDNTLAEAQVSMAVIRQAEFDWRGAVESYQRAIHLNPGYATAHQWYGELLYGLERFEGAAEVLERAQQLDPDSLIISTMRGNPYLYSGDYERAIEHYRETLEIDPTFVPAHFHLQIAYWGTREYDKMVTAAKNFTIFSGFDPGEADTLEKAFARSGFRGFLREQIRQLEERNLAGQPYSFELAGLYALLGDKRQGLDRLAEAQREHHPYVYLMKVDPYLENLRSDSRYQSLLRRLNFPE